MTSPTAKVYPELDKAYSALNEGLFGGTLPDCLITLQRKKKTFGFFCKGRFGSFDASDKKRVDEIALNPEHLNKRPAVETLSTLLHEMVHLWQHHFGTPTRTNHHNREWADKMKSIGLQPRNAKGGETGNKTSHVIMEAGAFMDLAPGIIELGFDPEAFGDLSPLETEAPAKRSGAYAKYVCAECGTKARAKPGLDLRCGEHGKMIEAVKSITVH